MGAMYSMGQGVPKDNGEAVKWFLKAADQELAEAQYDLGVMYSIGQGVPKDYVQAYMWFDLAGEQGYLEAQNYRDELAKMMNPAQVAEAKRLAKEWKPKGIGYISPKPFSR